MLFGEWPAPSAGEPRLPSSASIAAARAIQRLRNSSILPRDSQAGRLRPLSDVVYTTASRLMRERGSALTSRHNRSSGKIG